jgi:hypothetical protein
MTNRDRESGECEIKNKKNKKNKQTKQTKWPGQVR